MCPETHCSHFIYYLTFYTLSLSWSCGQNALGRCNLPEIGEKGASSNVSVPYLWIFAHAVKRIKPSQAKPGDNAIPTLFLLHGGVWVMGDTEMN
jgi:acetyl esterase/lipase